MNMKKLIFGISILLLITSCDSGKQKISGETKWQIEQNAMFKDASRSPLSETDLKNFKGLSFFEVDSSLVVWAKLTRTPDSTFFNMPTTTAEFSKERIFGLLRFELKGKPYQLNVYQGLENMSTPGFENYLFLPFTDETNGTDTYGGGRYIDLRIPQGDSLLIDFNKAYNPFCVYNVRYSCPIVPRINHLGISIEAGMKKFE